MLIDVEEGKIVEDFLELKRLLGIIICFHNGSKKNISDTSFFFKDSSVRCDEFRSMKDLVDPNSPHNYCYCAIP